MATSLMKQKKKELVNHGDPLYFRLVDWFMKQDFESVLTPKEIGDQILKIKGKDVKDVRAVEFGGWITLCRFRLEVANGITIVYSPKYRGYMIVKKGSFEASKFTMRHYRRAVLSAARAKELDDLGFLDPKHIDKLIEEVMGKTARKTRELAGLKQILVARWKELRNKERKVISHEKASN